MRYRSISSDTGTRGLKSWERPRLAQMFRHGFSPRTHVQLLINVPDVRVDSRISDLHRVGDFFVEITFRKKVEHLRFAGRKRFRFARDGRGLLKGLHDLSRNVTAHGRSAI